MNVIFLGLFGACTFRFLLYHLNNCRVPSGNLVYFAASAIINTASLLNENICPRQHKIPFEVCSQLEAEMNHIELKVNQSLIETC